MLRRFRFSLRWLLVGFAVAGVAFYFLFVRPTVAANRLVEAVQRGDYRYAVALGVRNPFFGEDQIPFQMTAKLQPRGWSDFWRFRHRVAGNTSNFVAPGSDMAIGMDYEVIFDPAGTRLISY